MTAVTVELEDLTAIVFAAGVIKTIEGALASRRRDPFVQPHLELTAAHDRLATAMRNATRGEAGTVVNFNEPLDDDETKALVWVVENDHLTPSQKAPKHTEAMSIYDRLAAKGCVVMGQVVTGVVWAGAPAVSDVRATPGASFAIKLTDRGRQKLEQLGYSTART